MDQTNPSKQDIETLMRQFVHRKNGQEAHPLAVFPLDDDGLRVALFSGDISEFDIVIKYRQQRRDGGWSRIRTPKHIHWAVDVLIKMHADPDKTKRFLGFLIRMWNETAGLKTGEERDNLSIESLLDSCRDECKRYETLGKSGEYSIRFLILLAKLLMIQEKTNRQDAYFFGRLLEKLQAGEDLFQIISVATHRGK